jgi:hypothetical protein
MNNVHAWRRDQRNIKEMARSRPHGDEKDSTPRRRRRIRVVLTRLDFLGMKLGSLPAPAAAGMPSGQRRPRISESTRSELVAAAAWRQSFAAVDKSVWMGELLGLFLIILCIPKYPLVVSSLQKALLITRTLFFKF